MGAAGVVEALLRTSARKLPLGKANYILDAQVWCSARGGEFRLPACINSDA